MQGDPEWLGRSTCTLFLVGQDPSMSGVSCERVREERSRAGSPLRSPWYLGLMATERSHRGSGVGSALLAPVLARCDAENIPAYLETPTMANVRFYRKRGFRVTQEVLITATGPRVWCMERPPRGELPAA